MIDLLDLIQLSARDYQGNMLTPYSESITAASAGTSVVINNHTTVPIDKLLLITSWTLLLTPGAAQYALLAQMRNYQGMNLRNVDVYGLSFESTVTKAVIAGLPYELLFFPGDRPVVIGTFNASVNTNTIVSSVRGLLIPRGMVSA